VGADGFPWATFVTNVSGSLALGLAFVLLGRRLPGRHVRAFVTTGFLGAYTTYSTFAVETDLLARHGNVAVAGAYVAASVLVGLAAVFAGMVAARALPRARQ